jgi:hypothetical protein
VRSAISNGGHNDITIRVTEADRSASARYKIVAELVELGRIE